MCFFELSFDIFVKRDQSPKTVCGGKGGCYESTHNASFSGVIFALKMVVLHFLHSIMGILCPMHWEKCVYFIFHFSLMVWHYFLNFFSSSLFWFITYQIFLFLFFPSFLGFLLNLICFLGSLVATLLCLLLFFLAFLGFFFFESDMLPWKIYLSMFFI